MLIGSVDMGRASAAIKNEVGQRQITNVMGDGSVRSRAYGVQEELITYRFPRVTGATWEALKAYIATTLKFSTTAISVTDDVGVARSVRYWDNSLRAESRIGGFWTVEITFRVEAA